ncbi:MAG: trypsin-like peptidase domain-containing protein [Hylemonella sp.]|uniref:S1C family serine protease n=1 Tax=Hylemonella sp. TaxID=2066020 RepID=UPI0022CC4796|nr:trypsin-like peptidase domain-containing protein [Hylemonella sp.]MCZ8252226.1 trypsin-like peptidase domain-containing protein [Hylemonella sp.]
MRQPALYSRSPRGSAAAPDAVLPETPPTSRPPLRRTWHARLPHWQERHWRWLALAALLILLAQAFWPGAQQRQLTQKDIDAAVLKTLETAVLPSPAARAAAIVAPSVVRVNGFVTDQDGEEKEHGLGTGVVIVDSGIILTNLHVVAGTNRIEVTFHDGTQSPAVMTGGQIHNDLAVLQAQKLPDDLKAATMRSTADLQPGDGVVAVGFPFGIGPSVSSGVVSGLKRSFRSPEGRQQIGNLIQFDAAANPGNSGGPLVTMDGEVVGIVTAILNPNEQRTFVGIGFAVPIENAASAVGMHPF